MKIVWTPKAKEDYLHWSQTDQKILAAINELIEDIQRNPFKGLGKPEPLKYALQGLCPGVSRAMTGWFIESAVRAIIGNWKLFSAAITMMATPASHGSS